MKYLDMFAILPFSPSLSLSQVLVGLRKVNWLRKLDISYLLDWEYGTAIG